MKKKNISYVLFPVVILIWGYVAYLIFYPKPEEISSVVYTSEKIQKIALQKDSFKLQLNYPDPFLANQVQNRKIKEENKQDQKEPVKPKQVAKPVVKWPSVSYKGMVKNQSSEKQEIALIAIENKEQLIRVGDIYSEIELVFLDKDSIQLQFKEVIKTFER